MSKPSPGPTERHYCAYVVGTSAPHFNGSIFVGGGGRTCARLAAPGERYCMQHAQILRRLPPWPDSTRPSRT